MVTGMRQHIWLVILGSFAEEPVSCFNLPDLTDTVTPGFAFGNRYIRYRIVKCLIPSLLRR
jgi:hypothetical protein